MVSVNFGNLITARFDLPPISSSGESSDFSLEAPRTEAGEARPVGTLVAQGGGSLSEAIQTFQALNQERMFGKLPNFEPNTSKIVAVEMALSELKFGARLDAQAAGKVSDLIAELDREGRSASPDKAKIDGILDEMLSLLKPSEDSAGSAAGGATVTGTDTASANPDREALGSGIRLPALRRGSERYFENEPSALFEFRDKQQSTMDRLNQLDGDKLSDEDFNTIRKDLKEYADLFQKYYNSGSLTDQEINQARQLLENINTKLDGLGVPR